MLKEFKIFISRGNVIDLAVGVIIGAAFGKIVTSVINDIIMPPIGYLLGGVNFKDLKINIGEASIAYGNFIQTVVEFLITSFCIFMIIKFVNSLKKKQKEEPKTIVEPTKTEILLAEIRDLMKH